MVGQWEVHQMSIDETAWLLSGQMVRNKRGTFYFDQPGNWVSEYGYPVTARLHRLGAPAAVYTNGAQLWYVNGQRHRLSGPAVTWADGQQQWWVNGTFIRQSGV